MHSSPAPANADHRVVTVWSDLASPSAALALTTLRRRATERRVVLLVDHRACARELLHQEPNRRDVVDGELCAITALRPDLAWRPWPADDDAYPVTTLLAMEAVQAAKRPECGGLAGSDELDAALRRALLEEGRCVSLMPVVLEVVRGCPSVDGGALTDALIAGTGRAAVMAQWVTASRAALDGQPQLITQGGYAGSGAGVSVVWPDGLGKGRPLARDDGDGWVDELLDTL